MAWVERYVSPAGGGAHNGTSEADAWTFDEAIAAYTSGHRINVIGSLGPYNFGANNKAFATAMVEPLSCWWRGYNLVPGDLDNDFTTAMPKLLWTTGGFTHRGHHTISNLDIEGATLGPLVTSTTTFCRIVRCRIVNTAADVLSTAVQTATTGASVVMTACYLAANALADTVLDVRGTQYVTGCTIRGGKNGVRFPTTNANLNMYFCTFIGQASHGIEVVGTLNPFMTVICCTFYKPVGDCVRWVAALPTNAVILGNIFAEPSGYGLNNTSGAQPFRLNWARGFNSFYAAGLGNDNGFGDAPSHFDRTLTTNPFVDAPNGDLTLVPSYVPVGIPGKFEGEVFTSYLDGGAVQRVRPVLRHPGMVGGCCG